MSGGKKRGKESVAVAGESRSTDGGMNSGNPTLRPSAFENERGQLAGSQMTLDGTLHKTAILLLILTVTAAFTWTTGRANPGLAGIFAIAGVISGLILALITIFVKKASPITAPLYAAAEGLLIGAISLFMEQKFKGIVTPAIGLTFGLLGVMLALYRFRIVQATRGFTMAIFGATAAIGLVYLVSFVMRLFGSDIPYIHGSGPIGIAFSLVVVGIAAFNFILDFAAIEEGVDSGAPKYMEWYCSFALLVTLVWLYIEILRLLAKLRGRD